MHNGNVETLQKLAVGSCKLPNSAKENRERERERGKMLCAVKLG